MIKTTQEKLTCIDALVAVNLIRCNLILQLTLGSKHFVFCRKQTKSSSFCPWSAMERLTLMLAIYWKVVPPPSGQTCLCDDFRPNQQISDKTADSRMTGTVWCTSRALGRLHSKGWTTCSSMSLRKEEAGRGNFKREGILLSLALIKGMNSAVVAEVYKLHAVH